MKMCREPAPRVSSPVSPLQNTKSTRNSFRKAIPHPVPWHGIAGSSSPTKWERMQEKMIDQIKIRPASNLFRRQRKETNTSPLSPQQMLVEAGLPKKVLKKDIFSVEAGFPENVKIFPSKHSPSRWKMFPFTCWAGRRRVLCGQRRNSKYPWDCIFCDCIVLQLQLCVFFIQID